MLQLKNSTPFAASLALMPDADGVDTMFAVVKGTFTLGATPQIASAQLPVTMAPEYWGDPALSSIKLAADVSLAKPSTDVLLIGSAWAPNGRAVSEMMVALQVGGFQHVARVFGDRVWRASGVGYAMTAARPFTSMPLTWERAFGGREETRGGPTEDPRNPVGVGFRSPDGIHSPDLAQVPNVEDPARPMSSWTDRPVPVGFAPLGAHWMPRRLYAGTYDEQWQSERAPYLPTDFDSRFLQLAPPPLISPAYLVGGEPVALHGFSPLGALVFPLPTVDLAVEFVLGASPERRPAYLDTVTFESDAERFSMVWRATYPCDKKALKVSEVRLTLLSLS